MTDSRICQLFPAVTLEHLHETPWFHYDTYVEAANAEQARAEGRRGDDEWVSEEEYLSAKGDGGGLTAMGMGFEVVDLNAYRDSKAQ